MLMASSQRSASGFGSSPVRPHVVTPIVLAARTAASTFSLRPEVLSAIRMSPRLPCASTWRANASSAP